MSNAQEFDDEQKEQTEKNPVRARMKQLEAEIETLRLKAAEADKLQKELAFSKAGIPMDAPMAKYFIKGYEGEFTPEAIRKAAEEANLIEVPKMETSEGEQQAWKRMKTASATGQTSEPAVDWVSRINNAKDINEIMQLLAQIREQAQTS
jgi:hypothetical protein